MCEDKEKTKYFKKCLGYCITGEVTAKSFFILIGPDGDNGKSTLISEVLMPIFGNKFITNIKRKVLFDMGNQSKNEDEMAKDMAKLVGKRIAICNEPSDGLTMNESEIKAITGNDLAQAKKLYRDPFDFIPIVKIMILTNKYVKFDDTSGPMKKRCKIFKMLASFTDKPPKRHGCYKRDEGFIHDLKTKYKSEIFTWLCIGANQYYKDDNLNPPEVSIKEMNEYIEQIDSTQLFLNEECDFNEKILVQRTELFDYFISWCKDKNEHMITREKFYDKLRSRKLQEKKSNGQRMICGLKIKEDEEKKPTKKITNLCQKIEDPYENGVNHKDQSITVVLSDDCDSDCDEDFTKIVFD